MPVDEVCGVNKRKDLRVGVVVHGCRGDTLHSCATVRNVRRTLRVTNGRVWDLARLLSEKESSSPVESSQSEMIVMLTEDETLGEQDAK